MNGAIGVLIDPPNLITGDFLLTLLRDSNDDIKGWRNGAPIAGAINKPDVTSAFNQFGRRFTNTYSEGTFQELILWNKDKENDRLFIEANTNTFYGIW